MKIVFTLIWLGDMLFNSIHHLRTYFLYTLHTKGMDGLYSDNIVHCGDWIFAGTVY